MGDLRNWKPAFTRSFTAPPPPDEQSRAAAFAERNSDINLQRLAKEFFALIDLARVPAAIPAALDRHDYGGALSAYRDFFMDRLGRFSPDERQNFAIRPRQPPIPFEKAYFHTADDLMQGMVVFGMIDARLPPGAQSPADYYDVCNRPDNQRKKGNVRIEFGAPGRANWTWQPEQFVPLGFPHLPLDASFMSAACGRPHFFTPLLVKYIETKDPKYWRQWIAFMDDICMNWRRDTVRAGLNPSHNQNNIEFFSDGLWANLSYLMQNSPEMVRSLPASTLARLLERMWLEYMPDAIQYGRNASTARRIMFDNWHAVRLAVSFPEFKGSDYCIRESVRALESLPTLSIMPDGCDVHDSRNYNKGTPEYLHMVYAMLRSARQAPPRADEAWLRSQQETMRLHADFIVRELWVTGGYPHWNLLRAERGVFVGDNPSLKRFVPEVFADPDNARIVSNIFEDGKAGSPRFTSDAFPYGGYYCVRTGWGKQDQWLYMPSTRPVSSITHPNNNNFSLYAYGQHLLADTGTSTPVAVDACNQIDNSSYRASPARYRSDPFRPVYGRAGAAVAYRTPLPRRWHTSDWFDVVEGEYSGPFARMNPAVFIDDVSHHRQIFFVRKLGLWIVVDRMKSPTEHVYEWSWPFYCPGAAEAKQFPGFRREHVVSDKAGQTIKTTSPDRVNLSLVKFSAEPMEITQSGFKTSKTRDWLVVSGLYPRRFADGAVAPDLAEVKPLRGENGVQGFSAQIPGGGRALFGAAPVAGTITLDDVTLSGEALLVTVMPDGDQHGVALGCKDMMVGGVRRPPPCADFEFTIGSGRQYRPIYRPLDLPVVGPVEDAFSDSIEVTLSHNEPGVKIFYTLDGTEPCNDSPLYTTPISIRETTVVKARAFRNGVGGSPPTQDGTRASAVARAVFTRQTPLEPVKIGDAGPGLAYALYEDDGRWPLSAFNLDLMTPTRLGICGELFDVPAASAARGGFAIVYTGHLNLPREGVYSIYAPPELINPSVHAGYDLRVFIDDREWYPATQAHNFGAWSLPMKAGRHKLKVVYINQQNVRLMSDFENWKDYYWTGTKPGLMISGPGLDKQPIPAGMIGKNGNANPH